MYTVAKWQPRIPAIASSRETRRLASAKNFKRIDGRLFSPLRRFNILASTGFTRRMCLLKLRGRLPVLPAIRWWSRRPRFCPHAICRLGALMPRPSFVHDHVARRRLRWRWSWPGSVAAMQSISGTLRLTCRRCARCCRYNTLTGESRRRTISRTFRVSSEVKEENDAVMMGNGSWGSGGEEFEGDKIYAATGPGYDDPLVGWHHCPPGMGIYQGVRIEARAPLFIHDLFVRPLLGARAASAAQAELWIDCWNSDIRRHAVRLEYSIYGQNFKATAHRAVAFKPSQPLGPGINYFRIPVTIPRWRRWDCATPWLYQLQVRLLAEDGTLLDTATRQFGLRSFHMDTSSEPCGRLYLNHREIRLRGANTMGFEQQDVMRGDQAQLIDDVLLAKCANMNFLRLTQRPVQPEIYDMCDRLGLLTQTDLPLFGVLRRNQFCEAVRQAGEMERLVRAHPCNIMVSYINEPFPNGWDKPHRHLRRDELERFFTAADRAVWQENPDRVIKAVDGDYDPPGPGLPDNHCYCLWYNGHGVDVGKLNRGYWQRVKPGWMYGCGEFGAEGLDPLDLMRRHYPADWLPPDDEAIGDWRPDAIIRSQVGKFHYMFFDTPQTAPQRYCKHLHGQEVVIDEGMRLQKSRAHDIDRDDENCRRYSRGLTPKASLNLRLKWKASENPVFSAISSSVSSVASSRRVAISRRTFHTYFMGESPSADLKI